MMSNENFEEISTLSTLAQWATEKGFFADPSVAKLFNSMMIFLSCFLLRHLWQEKKANLT